MPSSVISRRSLFLSAAAAGAAFSQTKPPTAADIIDRIKKNVGVPWRTETVDRVIAGSPDTPVKGVAATMMSTLEVIQRCAAAGRNFVITHEPTFYLHQDTTESLANNPTYKFKADFIRNHDMVIFRFHDHWHAHRPDGIATGMMRELGWEKNVDPQNPNQFEFPPITLARLAKDIQTRLKARSIRVIGDPTMQVNRVYANWGYVSQEPGIRILARPDIDVLVGGEAREWEVVEYAQDCAAAGQKKGFIVIGHVLSEQSGMKYCADWLKGFITDVPVEFIAAPEPFWLPDHPIS